MLPTLTNLSRSFPQVFEAERGVYENQSATYGGNPESDRATRKKLDSSRDKRGKGALGNNDGEYENETLCSRCVGFISFTLKRLIVT